MSGYPSEESTHVEPFSLASARRSWRLEWSGVSSKTINPEFLLQAYQMGIFPMAMEGGEIGWFSPDPRGVIPLDAFHTPKSLARVVRSGRFEVRFNSAFAEVIDGCADRDEEKIGCHAALTPTWNESSYWADYVLPMGLSPERLARWYRLGRG